MDHRLPAVFAIVCFALEGAGCASESARARREEILMPPQTGSTLQRRVMVEREEVPKKSQKKKESKRTTPKPTPEPEPSPQPPEDETPAPPDRFR